MWVLAEAAPHSHPTWADFTPTTWVAVVLFAIAAFWSIWKAVMYTIHPGEEEADHIKRIILGEPDPLQVTLSSDAGPVSDRHAGLTLDSQEHARSPGPSAEQTSSPGGDDQKGPTTDRSEQSDA